MFNNIYQGKKVLVTGHTGFKGTWLSLWLSRLGAQVIGYSLGLPTKPSLFEVLHLRDKIKDIRGDIRDLSGLKKIFNHYRPEIVFHLAAQSLVKKSYFEPIETFSTNIMGTVNLLEAARLAKKKCPIIIITSDKCFENKEWIYGYRETDGLGGRDPYSASKASAEIVTSAYRQSFFEDIGVASARAGNVVGGGDWGEDRLIPDFIKAIVSHKPIVLRNPQAVRPWQYVLEPLSGYLCLGKMLIKSPKKFSEAWNFGPKDDNHLTVNQLVKKMIKIWGKGSIKIRKDIHHESNLLRLDINKARINLSWQPIYDLDETINRTVNWYKKYYSGARKEILSFSLSQIENYENEAKKKKLAWSK